MSKTNGPPRRPLAADLARAVLFHVEAEAAYGVDALPRRAALEDVACDAGESVTGNASVESGGVMGPLVESVGPTPTALEGAPPQKSLETVAEKIAACRACVLCETRTKTVPGQGAARARLMFVGEAPGANEDRTGLAFVGRAGELLTKMIAAMGLGRDEVFIANVLKCRPPDNRPPAPAEAQACFHFLLDQIDLVKPEVICALGAHAANNLLERSEPIGRLRGRIFRFGEAKLIPTYHPSYLLQTPEKKRDAWQDLQVVMRELGLSPPQPSAGA